MRSVLEELRRRGAGDVSERPGRDAGISLRDDILSNLARILSTPRGAVPAFPDLGLTDATQVYAEYPDAVVWMQREILSTIKAHEPRLANIRIEHVPGDGGDLRLQFRIHAVMRAEGRDVQTSFTTTFNSDNHVTFG